MMLDSSGNYTLVISTEVAKTTQAIDIPLLSIFHTLHTFLAIGAYCFIQFGFTSRVSNADISTWYASSDSEFTFVWK